MKKPLLALLVVAAAATLGSIGSIRSGGPANIAAQPAQMYTVYLPWISNSDKIEIWYGTEQNFGPGRPQFWANILGNIQNPEQVASLQYALNGGAWNNLNVGPDDRRLAYPGDFNIELDVDDLQVGANTVAIEATYQDGSQASSMVQANYDTGPLPLDSKIMIDWSSVDAINDVALVVDGKWTLDQASSTVRTAEPGYDRLIAIGDMGWEHYEVEVPVIIHDQVNQDWPLINLQTLVGMILRWEGHSNNEHYLQVKPDPREQPQEGWWPLGALVAYERWFDNPDSEPTLSLSSNNLFRLYSYPEPDSRAVEGFPVLDFSTTYIFKAQVLPDPQGSGADIYRFRVWPQGGTEPGDWEVAGFENSGEDNSYDPGGLDAGSLVLLAHHSDVSFGNVIIRPLP
jgi:hypothetical protein